MRLPVGVVLGRPKGSKPKRWKLTGKDDEIARLLGKKISVSGISRLLGVRRFTVVAHIRQQLNLATAAR